MTMGTWPIRAFIIHPNDPCTSSLFDTILALRAVSVQWRDNDYAINNYTMLFRDP